MLSEMKLLKMLSLSAHLGSAWYKKLFSNVASFEILLLYVDRFFPRGAAARVISRILVWFLIFLVES